jgi:hypothetical protein
MAGHGSVSVRQAAALLDAVPLLIADLGEHAGKGLRRGAGLRARETRERRDHDHPGLGLPPRVDDRQRSRPMFR